MSTTIMAPAAHKMTPVQMFWRVWDAAGMLAVLILLFIGCSIFIPNFLSQINLKGLALSVATIGIVACTMLFCLAAGDFDLSVGSIVAFSGMIAALTINYTGSVALGIAAGILSGGLIGLFNGVVIAVLGINALIATLATMQMVRGAAYIVNNNESVPISQDAFSILGNAATPAFHIGGLHFIPITAPVWIMLGCFIAYGLLLNRTTFGRNTLAIGGNKEAAHLAGIAVTRTKVIIFTLQGLMSGFAGVILASRFTLGQPMVGKGLELDVISACVLGGVSLSGGVGSMLAVVVGVFIMGTVSTAMNLKGVNSDYQLVIGGAVLLAAVLIDRVKQLKPR
jgi:L-arabinose transport system permease protein